MTKARLHWFWRGAIAALFGAGCYVGWLYHDVLGMPQRMFDMAVRTGFPLHVFRFLYFSIYGLVPSFCGLLAYGVLTRWFGPAVLDGELHCRRCNHILRGLSEPRCPECGEGI